MAVYIRRAHKAEKLVLPLDNARDRAIIASNLTALTILDKGAGSFTLIFRFYDGSELAMDSSELVNGQTFWWNITYLMMSNTAQAGQSVKLLAEYQP